MQPGLRASTVATSSAHLKFERVMMRSRRVLVDLSKDCCLMVDRPRFPQQQAGVARSNVFTPPRRSSSRCEQLFDFVHERVSKRRLPERGKILGGLIANAKAARWRQVKGARGCLEEPSDVHHSPRPSRTGVGASRLVASTKHAARPSSSCILSLPEIKSGRIDDAVLRGAAWR